jgi:voltage-dependent calcium channel T type alpha-1G|tara:strand:+ start:123 stop:929 length:807 start_codon:yes stop_codon:yes gene_type:complete
LKNKRSDKKPKHPSKIFEDAVLFCIITSTLGLAIDNPLHNPDLTIVKVMFRIDIGFTLIFFAEAAIKIISKGLLHNNTKVVEPYYKSAWNQLDLFVVTVSMIDLSFIVMGIDMQQLQALKSFRSLRGLRPLRVISRNEGMRLVVNALLASLPSMTNVLLVCSLFILIFSIMGVSFFKGTFYHCVGDFSMDDIVTKQDCLDKGGFWRNMNAHFDDVLSAMLNLFQMTTTEGWVDVMNAGIDSVGIDMQPKYNNKVAAVTYFAAFMVVGS